VSNHYRHRVLAAAMTSLLLSAGVAPSAAQFGDFNGTFVVKSPAKGVIPDTVIGEGESVTWIRHEGSKRTKCVGDYGGLENEGGTGAGEVAFTCDGAKTIQVYLDPNGDDEGNYWWEFIVGDGAGEQRWRFDHPIRPVNPDDLKPRAKQPPAAYGDSVVLTVRALYDRINRFRCEPKPDEPGFWPMFQVCSQAGWTGRINMMVPFEATREHRSFTYDSTGALRFAFEVLDRPGFQSAQHFESRYYFKAGHLVRATESRNGAPPKRWEPSQDGWREEEALQLKRAAACLAASGAILRANASDSLPDAMPDDCKY
jgi:hypothetical protein